MAEEKVTAGTPPLLNNIVLSVGARGGLIILSIAITPVLVHRLGTEQFGIYALATVLGSGLTNVFALGLIPGIVAMLSRSLGRRDDAETQKVIGTAWTRFAFIGVFGVVILSLVVPYLFHERVLMRSSVQQTVLRVLSSSVRAI